MEFKFESIAPKKTELRIRPDNHRNEPPEESRPFIEVIDVSDKNTSSIEFKFLNDDNTTTRAVFKGQKPSVILPVASNLTGTVDVVNNPNQEVVLVFGNGVNHSNTSQIKCLLCNKNASKQMLFHLKRCSHSFCTTCLVDRIQNSRADTGCVQCPNSRCIYNVDDDDLAAILGDAYDEFAKRLKDATEARRKQEALEKVYKMIQDDADYIESFEVFECTVCYTDIEINGGLILKECIHQFCKDCLIGQIKTSNDFVVQCLAEDCKHFLAELEIRKLLTAEEFVKHSEKSLKRYKGTHAKILKQCLVPNCDGFIEPDENVIAFKCPTCATTNCLKCQAIHEGKSCQQYQDEKNSDIKRLKENADSENAIKELIARNEAMYCPRCGIPVMKEDGCDYITCTSCNLGICWRTKKPRQPIKLKNGKVIDGCHCKENNKKCHPDCRNCH